MDLGEAELPGRPGVLDRAERARPGPTGVPGQVDVVGARLDDARGDRPDPAARHELDPDPRRRVDRPQVGDELGEILDRVDVVVRRRADERLARLGPAERGDLGRRLLARQLTALARLGALGDLDLELVGPGEVRRRHAEAGRGDLLDPGVASLAVGGRPVPGRVLAALAGVRRPARPLHPDGHGLVGLGAERADAHRARDEAAGDLPGRLDVVERHRPDAARAAHPEPVADDGGIGPGGRGGEVRRRPVGHGLERLDDRRGVEVKLAVGAEAGQPGIREPRRISGRLDRPGPLEPAQRALGERREPDPAGPGRRRTGSTVRRPPGRARASRTARRRRTRRPPRCPSGRASCAGRPRTRRAAGRRPHRQRAPRARGSRRAPPRARWRAADGRPSHRRRSPSRGRGRRGRRSRRRPGRPGRGARPAPRAVWTAPTASTLGSGSRASDAARSEIASTSTEPPSTARSASVASRSSARARPAGPSPGSQVASSRRTRRGPTRASSPSRSATTGRSSRTVRGPTGIPPRSGARRPSSTRRSITARSRSGSIGGFVTWANAWRRWSVTGRSIRARAGVGVSSPMLQSGSRASTTIVRMSSRARSASRPARWRTAGLVAGRSRPAAGRRPPDGTVRRRRSGARAGGRRSPTGARPAATTGGGSRSSPRRPRGSPRGAGRRAGSRPARDGRGGRSRPPRSAPRPPPTPRRRADRG